MTETRRRTPMGDLEKDLKEPESLAHFLNAQVESSKELLKCGIIASLTTSSLSAKTKHTKTNLWGERRKT